MEQLRIEAQKATNQYNRDRTLRSIDHARTTWHKNSNNTRDNTNLFLRTNYEQFFNERNKDQNYKTINAARLYNNRLEA